MVPNAPLMKTVSLCIFIFILFGGGLACLLIPRKIQRVAIKWYDLPPRIMKCPELIKTEGYLNFLRFVGAIWLLIGLAFVWAIAKAEPSNPSNHNHTSNEHGYIKFDLPPQSIACQLRIRNNNPDLPASFVPLRPWRCLSGQ